MEEGEGGGNHTSIERAKLEATFDGARGQLVRGGGALDGRGAAGGEGVAAPDVAVLGHVGLEGEAAVEQVANAPDLGLELAAGVAVRLDGEVLVRGGLDVAVVRPDAALVDVGLGVAVNVLPEGCLVDEDLDAAGAELGGNLLFVHIDRDGGAGEKGGGGGAPCKTGGLERRTTRWGR